MNRASDSTGHVHSPVILPGKNRFNHGGKQKGRQGTDLFAFEEYKKTRSPMKDDFDPGKEMGKPKGKKWFSPSITRLTGQTTGQEVRTAMKATWWTTSSKRRGRPARRRARNTINSSSISTSSAPTTCGIAGNCARTCSWTGA